MSLTDEQLRILDEIKNALVRLTAEPVKPKTRGEVIAERFLERALSDIMQAEDCDKATAIYAKRLGVMLKDECWWAEDVGPTADLWLHTFNEANIDSTVEKINGKWDFMKAA